MPEIQPSLVELHQGTVAHKGIEYGSASMGNETLFRVVVLVLGTIPVALVVAAVLIPLP
jgi:hypothetical protein